MKSKGDLGWNWFGLGVADTSVFNDEVNQSTLSKFIEAVTIFLDTDSYIIYLHFVPLTEYITWTHAPTTLAETATKAMLGGSKFPTTSFSGQQTIRLNILQQ
jgi:hypothetical protein